MLSIIESKSVSINLCPEAAIPEQAPILLVSSDLQARVRAEHAAHSAGLVVDTVAPSAGPRTELPALVILDLDQIEDVAEWVRGRDLSTTQLVGFLSHVQRQAGTAAEAAGVRVYPRGRFWRQLPQLLGELS